jgi:hypothetical protein
MEELVKNFVPIVDPEMHYCLGQSLPFVAVVGQINLVLAGISLPGHKVVGA